MVDSSEPMMSSTDPWEEPDLEGQEMAEESREPADADEAAEAVEAEKCDRPYWIPAEVDFESLPEGQQAAIVGIINPAYRDLVMRATTGLEQATGTTIVFLLWLEILEQLKMGTDLTSAADDPESSQRRDKALLRYLQLIGAKNKASQFFVRLHEFRMKWGMIPAAPDPIQARFRPR